jgi:putative SOS response-associated peptidase YedK
VGHAGARDRQHEPRHHQRAQHGERPLEALAEEPGQPLRRSVSRFAEPDRRTSKPVVNRWFRRPTDQLFFFPGIWTEWEGDRGTKAKPHVGRHRLYGFLTTDPNELVKPVHEKAMPVVLSTPADVDQWLHAPMEEALTLQKPAAEDMLIVAEEEKAA